MIKSKIKSKLYFLAALFFLVIIVKQWNSEKDIVEFSLNPRELICDPNKKLLIIAFVVIAPDRFEKRNVIRSTWGNHLLAPDEFKIVFSVGQSENSTINEMLANEFLLHEDILQINNFTDSYDYLTTKIMKSFKWISKYCQSAQYILRINDDVMVNTFSLINYFKNVKLGANQIYGHLLRKTQPIRFFHKHRVDVRLYPREYYPDYPEGITNILLT